MSKADVNQFTDEEAAQRRDAIVRVMANTPPQPRTTKQPAKPRRKAAPTASNRKTVPSGANS